LYSARIEELEQQKKVMEKQRREFEQLMNEEVETTKITLNDTQVTIVVLFFVKLLNEIHLD
jgi:hypothetical protein